MRSGAALTLVTVMVMFAAVGCADDGSGQLTAPATASATDETTSDQYVAAIARSLDAGGRHEFQLTAEQAGCVAPRWLQTISAQRLRDEGVTPTMIGDGSGVNGSALSDLGLSNQQGNELYVAFAACGVDLREAFTARLRDVLGPDPRVTTCIANAITDELLRDLMIASMVHGQEALADDDDLATAVDTAISPCNP
jgi:hypothetical protein